jgi:hypothetical protein
LQKLEAFRTQLLKLKAAADQEGVPAYLFFESPTTIDATVLDAVNMAKLILGESNVVIF